MTGVPSRVVNTCEYHHQAMKFISLCKTSLEILWTTEKKIVAAWS
jgi:hypothetical protein